MTTSPDSLAALLADTEAEIASLTGPDARAFAHSIGLYNPANVAGYVSLLRNEADKLRAKLSNLQST